MRLREIYRTERNNQTLFVLAITLLVSYPPILTCFNLLFTLLSGGDSYLLSKISIFVIVSIIALSYLVALQKLKKDIAVAAVTLLLIYTGSFLFFPENRIYMFTSFRDIINNPFYVLFIFSFSGYVIIRNISDYDLLHKWMVSAAYHVIICSICNFIITKYLLGRDLEYMTFSYNMTMQTCLLLFEYSMTKKISCLITASSGFFMILIAGARGPIVCLVLAIVLYLVRNMNSHRRHLIPIMVVLTMAIWGIYTQFDLILITLNQILIKYSIYSRTIVMMLERNFFESADRLLMINQLKEQITFGGHGLYGDRAIIGTYAHNIIMELLIEYGYLGGIAVILALGIISFKACVSKTRIISQMSLAFITTGLFKLFLTGSYLNQEPCFFVLIGLGINELLIQKRQRRKHKGQIPQ